MEDESSAEVLSFCEDNGLAFVAYGPLGAHPLKQGAPLDPVEAVRWLLNRSPNILVIPGTTSIEHLEENVKAVVT